MTRPLHIIKAPQSPETLDFQLMLAEGIQRIQDLSGTEWTDYNEHDPGVTILEALVYALTDLAFRTSHPIADLLASSGAATKTPADAQPLFTGNDILPSAPVTEIDLRKSVFAADPGIKNAWFNKVDTGTPLEATYDLIIETYASEAGGLGINADTVLKKVRDHIAAHRPLGLSIRRICQAQPAPFVLNAEIEIGFGRSANKTLAEILFQVGMNLNAPPTVISVDRAFAQGWTPDWIYNGPPLRKGVITEMGGGKFALAPLQERAQAAIADAEGVMRIISLQIDGETDRGDADLSRVAKPSLAIDDLKKIRLYRQGALLEVDREETLSILNHLNERRRWQAAFDHNQMIDTTYALRPEGNAHRALSRYYSIQHLFPQIYGLSEFGIDKTLRAPRGQRLGEIRQLKGYLLFFEQLLANYLAQLNYVAPLFSVRDIDRTYVSQPLAHDPARPDDPPDIAPILGQGSDENASDHDWLKVYIGNLEKLTKSSDDFLDRRERALNHMLARFGEQFDDLGLLRLNRFGKGQRVQFLNWRIGQKQTFLENCVELGRRRGIGVNLNAPQETELQKRIRLKTGLDTDFTIIEHALLAPDRTHLKKGTALAQIDLDDRTYETAAFQAGKMLNGALIVVFDSPIPPARHQATRADLIAACAALDETAIFPGERYQFLIRLRLPSGGLAAFVRPYDSFEAARRDLEKLKASAKDVTEDAKNDRRFFVPTILPTPFFAPRSSVVVAPLLNRPHRQEFQEFVRETVQRAMPAHISTLVFFPDAATFQDLQRAHNTWLNARMAHPVATDPSRPPALNPGLEAAAQVVIQQLSTLTCQALIDEQERLIASQTHSETGT